LEKRAVRWEWLDPVADMNGSEDEAALSENGALVAEVIRTERTALKPMSVDEAVLQMELTPRRFLVFLNAKTETVNVLYRRKSGEFGLVEPTLG
jgi:putative sigma-54 modulation protein